MTAMVERMAEVSPPMTANAEADSKHTSGKQREAFGARCARWRSIIWSHSTGQDDGARWRLQ